jgi:hypothetical protein
MTKRLHNKTAPLYNTLCFRTFSAIILKVKFIDTYFWIWSFIKLEPKLFTVYNYCISMNVFMKIFFWYRKKLSYMIGATV